MCFIMCQQYGSARLCVVSALLFFTDICTLDASVQWEVRRAPAVRARPRQRGVGRGPVGTAGRRATAGVAGTDSLETGEDQEATRVANFSFVVPGFPCSCKLTLIFWISTKFV